MALAPGFHELWPTPIGVHRYAEAKAFNSLCVRLFNALRATQSHARGELPGAAFFASDDDLLRRVQLPEWQAFVRFLVESLRDTVGRANQHAWSAQALDQVVSIEGLWFQISNFGAFHEVHTHGNCSWSGVYCVQVDTEALRQAHPTHGERNGVTRFYGPPFTHLAGAHVDLGNAYLQPPEVEIAPLPGQLVIFPSWLSHQALPYAGELDRVIVSFNASVHATQGTDRLHTYSAA